MNCKKSALIHIGTEKTGTTTIQEFLNLNTGLFRKYGIACLKSPGTGNNRKIAAYCRDTAQTDDYFVNIGILSKTSKELWKKEFKAEFENELCSLGNKLRSVIISSEHLQSRLTSEKEISNLYRLLSPFFDEIKIMVYLRRQDQVANSLYSTACRVGYAHNNLLPLNISANDNYYNYYNLLEKWAAVFGKENIIPRIFEKENLIDSDLISDFIFYSGLIKKNWKIIRPKRQNESLSATVQELILSFNKNFPMNINNNHNIIATQLRQNLLRKLESDPDLSGKSKMPCRADASKFYQFFSESNKLLARKWFGKSALFSEDFSMYPEQPSPHSTKELEIFDHAFSVFAEFLSKYCLLPKTLIENIDLKDDNGAIFRDMALFFEETNPEIAYFLMKEAFKYRPNGQFIKDKLHTLALRIDSYSEPM